jgi:hypothetical protein
MSAPLREPLLKVIMAGRFRLLPPGVEGQYFKVAAEGWLFGAPGPWLSFGARPTYLVTDAQKSTIAARIRSSRYVRLVLGIPLAATAPLWMYLVPGLIPVETALLALVLYLAAVHLVEYLMIRSLLVDLPLSAERMTVTDMLRQQSLAMSVKSQVMLSGFFGVASALSLTSLLLGVGGPADQSGLRYIALFSGCLFILWLGMLAAKLWRRWRRGASASLDASDDRS